MVVTIWTGVSPGDRSPIRVCSEKLSVNLDHDGREGGAWDGEARVWAVSRILWPAMKVKTRTCPQNEHFPLTSSRDTLNIFTAHR